VQVGQAARDVDRDAHAQAVGAARRAAQRRGRAEEAEAPVAARVLGRHRVARERLRPRARASPVSGRR